MRRRGRRLGGKAARHGMAGIIHRLSARLADARSGQTEWLTTEELARRLGCSVKTVENKKCRGEYQEGTHWTKPPGMTVRWRWAAFVRTFERGSMERPAPKPVGLAYGDGIGPARRAR